MSGLRAAAEILVAELREPTEHDDGPGWILVRREAVAALDAALGASREDLDENPDYGPGNPDWERDFERTRE